MLELEKIHHFLKEIKAILSQLHLKIKIKEEQILRQGKGLNKQEILLKQIVIF